jgi:hypothetical protein
MKTAMTNNSKLSMNALDFWISVGRRALWALAFLASVSLHAQAEDESQNTVTINTAFSGGNAKVTAASGSTVHLEPDLRGGRPWFYWCFEATSTTAGKVSFVFPEKVAGFKNGAIGFQGPAISTDQGKSWKWMGTDRVEGNSFFYEFAKANERVRFAVTIPYLQTDLESFLKKNSSNRHLKTSVLTKSRNGRDVELLQIGTPSRDRKAVLVTGRHHAAETIASYVLEGFLQEAMSESELAKEFREKYVLYAVPFVDKDGVEEGDQGKNRRPHDHNRDYGDESIYPEIRAIKEMDKEHDFRLALDFHCPTLVMNDHQVMYFVGPKEHPAYNFQNVSEFAGWIKKGLPKSAPVGPYVWLKPVTKPTPMNSHYFGFKPGTIMAATLEIPFAPSGKATDPANCRKYGQVILGAWANTHFIAADRKPAVTVEKPAPETKTPPAGPPKTVPVAAVPNKFEWLPLQASGGQLESNEELTVPEITITKTPKPTADVSNYTREYVLELEKFNISNDRTNPVETSQGINAALQHARVLKANRIVFPQGTYLISETDPIVIDLQDAIIDLNGATLQINVNAEPKYKIVNFVDGAENVRLTNGTVRGDKDKHDYSSNNELHEWGHGLVFDGGRNLEADHLTLTNVTGDGANSRFSGARNRPELLARIAHSIYRKHLEQGAFAEDGRKIDSTEKTRSIEPFDLTRCNGEFEFGYSAGYLGYPFVRGRVYQAYFYDAGMKFVAMQKCVQFRKSTVPAGAKFAHLEFNQPEVSEAPLHAGAGKGSFAGRISNFTGPVDVHFHHNTLVGNRRLGMGYCGGLRWLIEDNLFARNGGTAPGYGIDLEDGWEFMQDVVIRNNRFKDNIKGDLVICAGTELLIEGNSFEHNVVTHARPHNYTFRNNRFSGGHVGYKTRTGVARIHDNTYENCTLSIAFDTKGVADGINRKPGETVATPPLTLANETLINVEKITGTYFKFTGATIKNAHFVAGSETSLIDFRQCDVSESSITYEADGPLVSVGPGGGTKAMTQDGPGINRRRSMGAGLPLFNFSEPQRTDQFFKTFDQWAREDTGKVVTADEVLVIGSSSIIGWRTMKQDLSPIKVIQRGFGGSRMKNVLLYKDFFRRYGARRIVIYEGDNDLGGSYDLAPQEFLKHCKEFVDYVRKASPDTKFYFLSIKPSTARMKKWHLMKRGNELLRDLAASDRQIEYIDVASRMLNKDGTVRDGLIGKDGVHMTRAGYDIWVEVVRSHLTE